MSPIVSSYSPSAGKLCSTMKPPRVPKGMPSRRCCRPVPGAPLRRQRDHHVGDVAVGRRLGNRLGVADRFERDRARGVDVLVDEVRRDLQGSGVVIEVALDVVVRQPGRRVDVEPEQIADGVAVLAAIETAQRHASGLAVGGRGVDLVLEPRDEFSRA